MGPYSGQWSSKQYPNGEFSVGWKPVPKPKKQENGNAKFDAEWRDFWGRDEELYRAYVDHLEAKGSKALASFGPGATEKEIKRAIATASATDAFQDRIRTDPSDWQLSSPPLPDTVQGTSLDGWDYEVPRLDPTKPVVKRSPKGRKGITRNGTKMVRNACHVLQTNYGKERLGFCTATLPSNPEYLGIWVCRWGEIVRKFQQEVKREMQRVGAPTEFIGVTEIQTKRSDTVGFCVPHLHFAYVAWDGKSYIKGAKDEQGKRKKQWYISHATIKEIWDRILTNEIVLVAELPEDTVNVDARIEVKPVRKSAEGYLGKYMSKGAKDVKKYLDANPNRDDIPSHWWHCTKELRDIVKGLITTVAPAMVEAITTNFAELIQSGAVQYLRVITKEINGQERTLGYAGRWKPDFNPISTTDIVSAFSTT